MKLSIITLACFVVGSSLAYAALAPVTARASTPAPVSSARVVHEDAAPSLLVVPEVTLTGTVAKWHPKPHVAEVCPVERRELVGCGEWVDGIQRCDAVVCRN